MTTVEHYPGGASLGSLATDPRPPRDVGNSLSTCDGGQGEVRAADLRLLAQEARSERHRLRAGLWQWSRLPRVRSCGRGIRSQDDGRRYVGLRVSDGHAGLSNLMTCGSVWADPVCASKVLSRRAVEVGSLLALAAAEGLVLGLGTFTMRHRAGEPLEALWAAARTAWQRCVSGRSYKLAVQRCRVVGWVRVWEVTIGRNGWHVHVHWVVAFEPGASGVELEDLGSGMLRRWSAGLAQHGREALRVGQEWHVVRGDRVGEEVGRYVSKMGAEGLGFELAYTQPGRAKSALKTRPVWSLLGEFFDGGDVKALRRWHEWEKASKGARQVGYGGHLRARFKVPEERTDEEIAAEELGSKEDTILWITPRGWASMVVRPMRIPALLTAAENGGLSSCLRLLHEWGDVEWAVPS